MSGELRLVPLTGLPEIARGAPLAELIVQAIAHAGMTLREGDVLVLAQKIVSKAEGRRVRLADVDPSRPALDLAAAAEKDPRVVELMLRESNDVVRVRPGLIIVEHRLGFVMANAGIDQSNVGVSDADPVVLLLPLDPDRSARALREAIAGSRGVDIGVVINDSFGRAWRNGVCGVAIGVAGVPALVDMRNRPDREGRPLRVTQVAAADELAAAASLVMGQAAEGVPAVLVRGFPYRLRESAAGELVRDRAQDLFR
jgi:coenzyme F420-0:L-glutamate ligase / coenzyme F420-1:gamma-L-glutamate ligase